MALVVISLIQTLPSLTTSKFFARAFSAIPRSFVTSSVSSPAGDSYRPFTVIEPFVPASIKGSGPPYQYPSSLFDIETVKLVVFASISATTPPARIFSFSSSSVLKPTFALTIRFSMTGLSEDNSVSTPSARSSTSSTVAQTLNPVSMDFTYPLEELEPPAMNFNPTLMLFVAASCMFVTKLYVFHAASLIATSLNGIAAPSSA